MTNESSINSHTSRARVAFHTRLKHKNFPSCLLCTSLLASALISGCGGGEGSTTLFPASGGSATQPGGPSPTMAPAVTATPAPTPAPVIDLIPTATPVAVSEPTPLPVTETTPTPAPTIAPEGVIEPSGPLSKPVLEAQLTDGLLQASWEVEAAISHRLIIWLDNDVEPQVFTTENTNLSIVAADNSTHTLMVESYDDTGFSLFSDPVTVEVAQ